MYTKLSFHCSTGLKKSLWKLIALAAFGAATYQMVTVFIQFYQYDVTVTKTFVSQRETTFPAITVCNMNPVKQSAVSGNIHLMSLSSGKKRKRRLAGEMRNATRNQPPNKTVSMITEKEHTLNSNQIMTSNEMKQCVNCSHSQKIKSRHKRAIGELEYKIFLLISPKLKISLNFIYYTETGWSTQRMLTLLTYY